MANKQMHHLKVGDNIFEIVDSVARSGISGAPSIVSLSSAMIDTSKLYLYIGSETGYTSGNWYYYNGTSWVSGGQYGDMQLDTSLTTSGMAADAKSVGDRFNNFASTATAGQAPIADGEGGWAWGDVQTELDTTLTQSGQAADAKVAGDAINEVKADLADVTFPLELVATYENKILRKTGMTDYNGWTVYKYKLPDNCEKIHIKTNFYGNVFIIFTDMGTDGDFSSNPYTQFPSSGYSTPTTVDQDLNTNKFSYVWIPLYNASGVTVSATASLIDIVNDIYDNTIIANNTTGGVADLNDAERNHIYVFTSGISNISNYPPIPNGGTLLCYAAYNIDNIQLFVSTQNAIYIRRMWGTTWGAWKQIPTADNVQNVVDTVVDTVVNTAFSGYYPYNILSAFKNITCIGDSLTYSQVYTGASQSRQAYNPYPTILAKKCGASETILATPGDTALQAWDRNGENITQKDAQLTIVYLGTNGGLTDTIDADLIGDDYTQWADTNTGAYGKIVAKSIAVGSRVVLVKVHSSSGGAPITNSVIEQMATRFNVPVIGNTYLSGVKYHSYPDGSGTNGTHYNDFGYAVFADQVANSISQLSAEDAVKIIPI